MVNFEKYKDEILEKHGHFAKCQGKIVACCGLSCDQCDFQYGMPSCTTNKIRWLYKEVAPTLTKKERAFCEIVKSGYIAREKDGVLFVFQEKPIKGSRSWASDRGYMCISDACFSFIQWEDEKPWSIKDLLKLEIEKE